MRMKLRVAALAAGIVAIPLATYAGGLWPTLPIVGSSGGCPSNSTLITSPSNAPWLQVPGSTQGTGVGGCAGNIPAGPVALTGNELIPADTGLANGAPPQTVTIPSGLLGAATNRIIGGDFDTNLAQRLNSTKGIAALATLSPTAAVMTADRWWVIAPAAGVTVTMDSTVATSTVPDLNNTKALRIARTSSGAAGAICVGQTLDQAASAPLLGKNAIFSFYEENGAGNSATNGAITVHVDYTSAADGAGTQATLGFAGLNGSKFALGDAAQAGTPTNYTAAITAVSNGTTGTVASGIATIPASATWTRYGVSAPIPVLVPGTATPVTSVSVSICFTPTATTAISTDWIEIEGLQLEAAPSSITAPKAFVKRDAATEQTLQEYYLYFNYEDQALVAPVANTSCLDVTTTLVACSLTFPVPMRVVPVVKFTDGFQTFTSTAYTTLGALSSVAVYTQSVTSVPSNKGIAFKGAATTTPAAGTANWLFSLGTSSATGIISASAEP